MRYLIIIISVLIFNLILDIIKLHKDHKKENKLNDDYVKCTECHRIVRKDTTLGLYRTNNGKLENVVFCPNCKDYFFDYLDTFIDNFGEVK